MLKSTKLNIRMNVPVIMALSTFFCFGASIFRFLYTDTKMFLFLNWNLFLAFTPWALTSFVIKKPKIQKSRLTLFAIILSWLMFFPNAPYILTDLFHLRLNSSMPIWFDLILILSFAWTGLLFGFLSLWDIEKLLLCFFKRSNVIVISIGLLFLSSFGVYLGRYLRWNSWDIVTNPLQIFFHVGDRLIYPFEHPGTWGMTVFMGLFLNMIYLSVRLIKKINIENEVQTS